MFALVFCLAVLSGCLPPPAEGARILGVFPFTAYSHYILGNRFFTALAEKGHDVTIITPYREKSPPKNYREIYLDGAVAKMQGKKTRHVLLVYKYLFFLHQPCFELFWLILKKISLICFFSLLDFMRPLFSGLFNLSYSIHNAPLHTALSRYVKLPIQLPAIYYLVIGNITGEITVIWKMVTALPIRKHWLLYC